MSSHYRACSVILFGSHLLWACGLAETRGLSDGESGGASMSVTDSTSQGTAGALAGSDPTGGAGGGEDGSTGENPDGQSAQDGDCAYGNGASSACTPCATGNCNRVGLRLYLKLDEKTGTLAMDSSGNNLNGTYVGATAVLPTSASDAPLAAAMWDATSLSFQAGTYRQAVTIASTTANFERLKLPNDLTLSIWFKTTVANLDSSGSELLSLGDHYILRVGKSTSAYRLEFNKHVDNMGTSNTYCQTWYVVQADAGTPAFLDGNWHHFAATSSSTGGTALYLDGTHVTQEFYSTTGQYAASNINYASLGQDFWLGRHGYLKDNFDFQGNLDEVRIYDRLLSIEEIQALAQGKQLFP